MTGHRRTDLENSRAELSTARMIYGAEGCVGLAADEDDKFFAILDDSTIGEFAGDLEDEDVRGGRAIYEFDSAAARDAFLDARCRGMRRMDRR